MKKLILLLISGVFLFAHITCYCANPFTCTQVVSNLQVAKTAIKLNYKVMDELMGAKMYNIKQKEKEIKEKQKIIAKLIYQIRKIQEAIALEENKKSFLLKKIKEIKIYQGE